VPEQCSRDGLDGPVCSEWHNTVWQFEQEKGTALMRSKIGRAFRYWLGAIVRPGDVLDAFRADPDKLVISLWILLLFALLYSITALILYFVPVLPAMEPWIPITRESYYLYQAFWTIPWGLATGIMLGGIAHILAVLGRGEGSPFTFEDSLAVNSIAWVVPSFVLMWIPETFVVPFTGSLPWPPSIEILRLAVLPPIWQTTLVFVGMRKTHRVSWFRGIVIGVTVTCASFLMFLPVMR
jgi:hypothetical protein